MIECYNKDLEYYKNKPYTMKEATNYVCYLEGLVNELMAILQRRRKELGFEVMDNVNVAIVQKHSDKLTNAIYMFVNKIIQRVRIIHFLPVPLDCGFTTYTIMDFKKKEFTFDLYMEKY